MKTTPVLSIDGLADRLITAEMTRTPVELPSVEYPGMTVEEARHCRRQGTPGGAVCGRP